VRWTSILPDLPQKMRKKLWKSQATVMMATTQAASPWTSPGVGQNGHDPRKLGLRTKIFKKTSSRKLNFQ